VSLADIYLKAASVIRVNGHARGGYYQYESAGFGIERAPSECRVCIAGALSIVLYGNPIPPRYEGGHGEDMDALAEGLLATLGISRHPDDTPVMRLAAWNDAADRTGDQVIAALEQAAREVAA
jgi:hypothetical protein